MATDPNLASQLLAMRKVDDDDIPNGNTSGVSTAAADDKNKITSYRDFSRVLPEKHNDASSLIAQSTTAKEPTFPVKLHMILSNPDFQDIIAWLPHGRSWRILQQKAFEERVIPLYFRHGRYSSFARQVNGWGFKRITHGSDYNSYYRKYN
jgi:HSF-type DNA-binding